MNALQRLIRTRMDELGLSLPEAARRGGFTSHSTIYSLLMRDDMRQVPRTETLKKLAKALEVDLHLLRVVAGQAAGYELSQNTTPLDAAEDISIIVAAAEKMPPADRRKLRRLAVAFLDDPRDEEGR